MIDLSALLEDCIEVTPGTWVPVSGYIVKDGILFVRQFTPDGKGGGFVAVNAEVPSKVPIPFDWFVFPHTKVLAKAERHMAGQGPRIKGNVRKVSRHVEGPAADQLDRRGDVVALAMMEAVRLS